MLNSDCWAIVDEPPVFTEFDVYIYKGERNCSLVYCLRLLLKLLNKSYMNCYFQDMLTLGSRSLKQHLEKLKRKLDCQKSSWTSWTISNQCFTMRHMANPRKLFTGSQNWKTPTFLSHCRTSTQTSNGCPWRRLAVWCSLKTWRKLSEMQTVSFQNYRNIVVSTSVLLNPSLLPSIALLLSFFFIVFFKEKQVYWSVTLSTIVVSKSILILDHEKLSSFFLNSLYYTIIYNMNIVIVPRSSCPHTTRPFLNSLYYTIIYNMNIVTVPRSSCPHTARPIAHFLQ